MGEDKISNKIFDFKRIYIFATIYAFLCSLLYQMAYWSKFDINIFQYLSFIDILHLSIFPLVPTLIIISFYYLIWYSWLLPKINIDIEHRNSETEKKQSKLYKSSQIGISFVLIFFCIILAFTAHNVGRFPYAIIFILLFIITLSISRNISQSMVKQNEIFALYKDLIIAILVVVQMFPFFAFVRGQDAAQEVLNNFQVSYAKTCQFNVNKDFFGNQKNIKYVGYGGRHYVFLSIDNSKTYIIDSDKIDMFELEKQTANKNWLSEFKKYFRYAFHSNKTSTSPSPIKNEDSQ